MLLAVLAIASPSEDQVLELCSWVDDQDKVGQSVLVAAQSLDNAEAVKTLLKSGSKANVVAAPSCSSTDDWCALAAVLLADPAAPGELERAFIFDATGLHEQPSYVFRVAEWSGLMRQLTTALDQAKPRHADSCAAMLRTSLLRSRGGFVAALSDLLGDLRNVIDCCELCFRSELPSAVSTLVYSRKKPLETWVDLHSTLQQEALLDQLSARYPSVSDDLQRIKRYYRDGRMVLDQDRTDLGANRPPQMIGVFWLSTYLSRVCEYHISNGDGSTAIVIAARVLESYLDFRLFEFSYLYFDSGTLSFERTSKGHRAFAAIDRSYGGGLRASLEVLGSSELSGIPRTDVEQLIQLRNRSQVTHGAQRMQVNAASVALTSVKSFINSAEKASPAVGDRWKNLLASSFHLDWRTLPRKTIDVCLEKLLV